MVGTKLTVLIKNEIKNYLGIPYWMNQLQNGKVIKEGVLGGKGNWEEINNATLLAGKTNKINVSKLSKQQLYNFQKKHNIGIDCSGLVYHLSDFLAKIIKKESIVNQVIGVNSKYGVRHVSAKMLTSDLNAIKIASFAQIKTGDMIRMNNGRHILFIIEFKDNTIYYVHSSDKTEVRGVHLGSIKITDPKKDLDYQQWTDKTVKNIFYNQLYFPEKGDGIYRLKCLF